MKQKSPEKHKENRQRRLLLMLRKGKPSAPVEESRSLTLRRMEQWRLYQATHQMNHLEESELGMDRKVAA